MKSNHWGLILRDHPGKPEWAGEQLAVEKNDLHWTGKAGVAV